MEGDKKRSRKTKLVPRDLSDSDNELEELQNKVEQTLARIKGTSKKRKEEIIKHPVNDQPSQFSIKVEIEECDDDEVLVVPSSEEEPSEHEEDICSLELMGMLKASSDLARDSPNIADKILHLQNLNYCKPPFKPHVKTYHEIMIEKVFMRWQEWLRLASDVREIPLCYKCYICDRAWWHLSEFQDHMYTHKMRTFCISFEIVNCIECNIVAHFDILEKRFIDPGTRCWRCGDMGSAHDRPKICPGCNKDLFSCSKLKDHQWYCNLFKAKNIKLFQAAKKMYKCHLCPQYYFQESSLFDHMVLRHTVRSDVPLSVSLETCVDCKQNLPEFHHVCPYRLCMEVCANCNLRFASKELLNLHKLVTKKAVRCPICNKHIRRECLLPIHMVKHTHRFCLLYKCLVCPKPVYFDPTKLSDHSKQKHVKFGCSIPYDIVFVPSDYEGITFKNNAKLPVPSNVKFRVQAASSEVNQPTCTKNYRIDSNGRIINNNDEISKIVESNSKISENCIKNDTIEPKSEKDVTKNDEIIKSQTSSNKANSLRNKKKADNVKEKERIDVHNAKSTKTIQVIKEGKDVNLKAKTDNTKTYREENRIDCETEKPENGEKHIQNTRDINCVLIKQEKPDENSIENNEIDVEDISDMITNIKSEFDTNKEAELTPIISNVISVQTLDYKTCSKAKEIEVVIKSEPQDYLEERDKKTSNNEENINKVLNSAATIEIKVSNKNNDLNIKEEPLCNDIKDMSLTLKDIRKIYHIDVNVSANTASDLNIDQKINIDGDNENNWELLSNVFENFNEVTADSGEEYENDLIILEPKEDVLVVDSDSSSSSDSTSTRRDETSRRCRIYQCQKCSFRGVYKEFTKHKREDCLSRESYPLMQSQTFTCTPCNTKYKTFKRYLKHFKHHGYPKHACPQCSAISDKSDNNDRHVSCHIRAMFVSYRSIQSKESCSKFSFRCKLCDVNVDRTDFFEHWEKHLVIKNWSSSTVVNHKKHVGPYVKKVIELLLNPDKMNRAMLRSYRACVVCDRKFNRKNDCVRHLIEHLLVDALRNKDKYSGLRCQICDEEFHKIDRYRHHLRFHASLPVYKCELCDKSFSDSSNFSKHKKVHNMKIVVCDICQRKFHNKDCLIKHIQEHEGPQQCPECERCFFSEASLRKHQRATHDKHALRYSCRQCDLRFVALKHKWDHMWQVHKERPVQADCAICGAGFRKMRDLKLHVENVHSLKQPNQINIKIENEEAESTVRND